MMGPDAFEDAIVTNSTFAADERRLSEVVYQEGLQKPHHSEAAYFSQARCASRAMVWMVFPNPISSAKIPFRRRVYIVINQSSPMC